MIRIVVFLIPLLLVSNVAGAGDTDKGDKLLDGMSIVGNDEAPKSLVIVPWKSSGLVHSLDVSTALGPGREPVDRDVFLRELDYYQIRAASHGAAGTGSP
jgi:hypothetical protein